MTTVYVPGWTTHIIITRNGDIYAGTCSNPTSQLYIGNAGYVMTGYTFDRGHKINVSDRHTIYALGMTFYVDSKYWSGVVKETTTGTAEEATTKTAQNILNEIQETISKRGEERDTEEGERSFEKSRDAWWAIFGNSILERGYPTESDMCYYMTILKLVRSVGGNYRYDDYLDAASYAILGAEAAEKENSRERPYD